MALVCRRMKDLIHEYGAWIVFALVLVESVGVPVPGDTVLISAAIYAGATRDPNIVFIILAAILAATIGSTIGLWIGQYYGYPLLVRYGPYIGLTETRIKIAQYLFRRRGGIFVFLAKFVAILRSIMGFIAGASRMPFGNFIIANCAGAVGWALLYGLGAFYLGKGFEAFSGPATIIFVVVVGIAVAGAVLWFRRKEQELAAAAEHAIPGPLQARSLRVRKRVLTPTRP